MEDLNKRGFLTEAIQKQAKEFLGREITQEELRLFPFLDYCWKNGGYVDRSKLSLYELDILLDYNDKGICERRSGYSFPTKEFYNFVQFCLLEAYVQIKEA